MVEIATFKPPEFKATHPHFVNYVWQQLEDKYGSQAIYSAGYRVYTTAGREDPKAVPKQRFRSGGGTADTRHRCHQRSVVL